MPRDSNSSTARRAVDRDAKAFVLAAALALPARRSPPRPRNPRPPKVHNRPMGHKWIDEGLGQAPDREKQEALAAERQLHRAIVIKQQGPDLMLRLVSAIRAAVEEYKEKAHVGSDKLDFEPLPRGSFRVTKVGFPSVDLECHPDYDGHVVYCNMVRIASRESGASEMDFGLQITADDLDNLELRHDNRPFANVDDVAEFLLKSVLFPPLQQL